jgi:hypothetical protein
MENADNIKVLDKIDELLSLRESKKLSLLHLNRVIREGIATSRRLPRRWYVKNPNDDIIEYLGKKYNRDLSQYSNYMLPIGLGEIHGEFALIPHDIDYSWEITHEEFDLAIKLQNNGE